MPHPITPRAKDKPAKSSADFPLSYNQKLWMNS